MDAESEHESVVFFSLYPNGCSLCFFRCDRYLENGDIAGMS